jgi:hypothetical protein
MNEHMHGLFSREQFRRQLRNKMRLFSETFISFLLNYNFSLLSRNFYSLSASPIIRGRPVAQKYDPREFFPPHVDAK